ncbi:MAG: septum formation initiator family protein [Clostridiales bacterium]|nr:septum formation initiator family protein [Clostridiales bacterium]
MKDGGFFKNGTVRTIAALLCVALFLGFVAFMTSQFLSQRRKLAELNSERQQLNDRINELLREQERLQSDLEYIKSPEGLRRYAREELGYILPGDERIYE